MTALEEIKTPVEAEIERVVQSVNEWDDRTSPDDYPEHLLITSEELADILRNFAETTLESVRRENEKLRQFLFPYADRTDISGISWDGKYLIGDKDSIMFFHEMKNRGEQIDVYKRAYDQNEAALKARAEAAEAEVKRLQAEIDRKSSMPGDHRYWEGRYRDEAADNEKLKAGIKRLSDEEELLAETTDGDVMSLVSLAAKLAEAEQLARTYEGEANQLRDVSISNRIRAEEAEAGENKLREALRPFVTVSENWVDNSGWTELSCKNDRIVDWFGASDFLRARTALASTGGEHNGN